MAESVEARIATLLMARVASKVFTPPIPIAYPNVSFTPTSGTYLQVTLLANANRNRFVSDDSPTEHRGILQVDVVSRSDGGIIAPTEIAAAIANHFERGTPMWDGALRVIVTGRPTVASPIQEPDRVRVPVSINWQCFA